jgi:hypothetical protein
MFQSGGGWNVGQYMGPLNRNQRNNLQRYVETFQRAVAAGVRAEVLNRLAVRVISSPEMITTLYLCRPTCSARPTSSTPNLNDHVAKS